MVAAAFDCGRHERPPVVENPGDQGDRSGDTPKRRADEPAAATTSSATKHPSGDADPRKDAELAPATPKAPTMVSTGTCFFVSSSGLALSSLHVVRGAPKVLVIDAKGRRSTATVLAKDEPLDLVALQVDAETVPQVLPLTEDAAALGDHVFTIGFPEVGDLGVDPKLTEGSISGERGLGLDFLLQTSAPVQPGNSGGLLVNETGTRRGDRGTAPELLLGRRECQQHRVRGQGVERPECLPFAVDGRRQATTRAESGDCEGARGRVTRDRRRPPLPSP